MNGIPNQFASQDILPLNLNSTTEEVLLTIHYLTDYLTFSTDAPSMANASELLSRIALSNTQGTKHI